jgi:hypothetical protein
MPRCIQLKTSKASPQNQQPAKMALSSFDGQMKNRQVLPLEPITGAGLLK